MSPTLATASSFLQAVRLPGSKQTILAIGAAGVILYLSLVRALRWRRFNEMQRKYGPKFEGGTITPQDAQEIMAVSAQYDMPMLMNYALSFALFKTYGIPTISKLLSDTKELKSAEGISKRYADTEILISTWVACPLTGNWPTSSALYIPTSEHKATHVTGIEDPRGMIALARVNWLHSKYPIKRDDYLYTLGLFVFEGAKWARRYGWRALSPLEAHAYFIFWGEIGRRMGIEDIPATADAFKEWIRDYEASDLVPAQTNHDVANYTTEELLHAVPELFGIKNFARRLTICLLEDNVRIAMMQPEQPAYLHSLLTFVLCCISLFQGYLCLPRTTANYAGAVDLSLPSSDVKDTASGYGMSSLPRQHPRYFQAKPWYMPEPQSLVGKLIHRTWIALGAYDALPGPNLRSEGYRLEEMGPLRYEKVGHDEVLKMAEGLYGCPITGPFGRSEDGKTSA